MTSSVQARSPLTPEHWFLLWVLGAANFFEGYDYNLVTVALPAIRGDFGLTQSSASYWLSILFLGALPALFLTRYADKIGRRKVLLVSIVGYTAATAVTALAPTIGTFVGAQFISRFFLVTESAVSWTMIGEELPADRRGFGFGFLATLNAMGAGFGSLLWGVVFEPLGVSWRALYWAGIPPLLIVIFLRRRLPESRRFEIARESGHLSAHWTAILRKPHLRLLLLVCTAALFVEITTASATFVIDFLQEDRGFSATAAALVLNVAGLLAIPALILSGSLSDRIGRRQVGCTFLLIGIAGGLILYFSEGGLPIVLFGMWLSLTGMFGAWPTLNGITVELFPTALRGQSGAWSNGARTISRTLSFVLTGALISWTGALSWTVLILSAGPLIAAGIYWFFFPDTHGRELEETSHDELAEDLPEGVLEH